MTSRTPRGTLVSTQPMSLTPQQELAAKLQAGLTGGTQQQAAPDLNAFMGMADPFTAEGLQIYGSLGNEQKVKILESKISQYTDSDPALAQRYFDVLTQVVATQVLTPEQKLGEFKLDKKGLNFGITTSFGRLPSGIHDGVIDTSMLEGRYKKSGVAQLQQAMMLQHGMAGINKAQQLRFKAITEGGKVVEKDGNLYLETSLGRELLPTGKTVTTQVFNHLTGEYEDREIPFQAFKAQEEAARKRQLAFGDTRGVLGTGGISFQQQLLAAGVGGAANLAISQGQSYYRNTVYGEATGSMARSHAAAQALGRATWYKEQNKNYTISRGGSGHGIVNHYVRSAVSAEDKEAMNSLANSHDAQVKEFGQEAFDRGKDLDILWLRIQTINQAKALNASISARVTAERATALDFGNQLGISQNEALQILRDKSQGEQALADMLAFQLRLEAQSTGVVT